MFSQEKADDQHLPAANAEYDAFEYDLFEDVLARIKFCCLSRADEHKQLRRVAEVLCTPKK